VDRGRIAHFRTPGRHLRFRAADVADFLRAWGYAVPRELARANSRSVLVVGSKDTAAHVTRSLGDAMPVRNALHPYDALVFAGSDPADIYVIDVKEVARDADPTAVMEALHRASAQATFVALADEGTALPAFATRIGRTDGQALKTLLVPEAAAPAAAAGAQPAAAEEVRPAAAGGGGR
jgi:hypothetical protein